MASLRSLLNATQPADYLGAAGPVKGAAHAFYDTCPYQYQGSCEYQHVCCFSFIVPSGASKATFEVWAGGGGGAGVCCCMWGPGGSSGSYARKTVNVTPTECYYIQVGPATCCRADNCGFRGCYSVVCGPFCNNQCVDGCSNYFKICAQGGYSGCAQCFLQCGLYPTPFGVPLAYGGDINIPGVRSCYWHRCWNNLCYNMQFTAYPGGIVNRCGGVVLTQWDANTSAGTADRCRAQGYLWGANSSYGFGYVPGLAGVNGSTCGGNCYCGHAGSPGAVRVTYE